jgi:signal transduction histidine kinase
VPGDDRAVVLYVDDEAGNLRVFEANFRSRFRLLTAPSGEEGLTLLDQHAHDVGVLLADQRMPGMTGAELLEKAREAHPDIARMIVTAYSDVHAVMDAVNRGQVSRYFVKPWNRDELGAALDEALRVHQMQVKLREYQSRLLRSERLATLGQFAAGIAHELMNPVSYVSQNVTVLREELDHVLRYAAEALQENPRERVAQVLDGLPSLLQDLEMGTQHIRTVASNIRTQARGEEPEKDCDLVDVTTWAAKLARPEIGHRARVQVRGEAMKVHCGPIKLTQVLLNLMVNSAQAISEGKAGLIEVTWAAEDKHVLVRISDNGSGIAPEHLPKVFQPLFSTKPAGVGTGLGLGICRELVRSMDGELTLESALGQGTTVTLKLVKT